VETLVSLRDWADEHGVMTADLHQLAMEGVLPVARRNDRLYLAPTIAEKVWAEHGPRMLAEHLPVPGP